MESLHLDDMVVESQLTRRNFMKGDTVEFSVSYNYVSYQYESRPSRFFAMRNKGLTVTEALLERVGDVRSVRMILLEKNNHALSRKNTKNISRF